MRMFGVVTAVLLSLSTAGGQAAQAPTQAQVQAEAVPPSLADMTPRSLVTMPIIGWNDETIGRVEDVVRDKRNGRLAFLVRTDEGERLALEVQQVEVVDLQLRLREALSSDGLQQRIKAFEPDHFVATARDTELAELQNAPSG